MGHYAKINSDNIVVQVIVAKADFIDTLSDKDSYIKTSYNTSGGVHYTSDLEKSEDQSKALRKNYAGKNFTYDKSRDAFIPPKRFASWILDEDTAWWVAPVTPPSDFDRSNYYWDEDVYKADNSKGWVKFTNVFNLANQT